MKALRQGSVSISLSPAARSCAGPRPASGVSGYQDPASGHEEVAVESQRATGFSGHCAADQLPIMRSVVNDSGVLGGADQPIMARQSRTWNLPSLP